MSNKQSKLAALGLLAATAAMSSSKMEDDFVYRNPYSELPGFGEYTYQGDGHKHHRKTQLTKSQAKKRKASKQAGKARKNNR